MTQHHRLLDDEKADGAMRIVVDIAAADAHGMDGNTYIVGAQRFGDINLAQRQLVLALQHQCVHAIQLLVQRRPSRLGGCLLARPFISYPLRTITTARMSESTVAIHKGSILSIKRIHNRWSATKQSTLIKTRSNVLVSMGRNPRLPRCSTGA